MNSNDLRVKSELDFIYITSNGCKYLNKMDALCAESQIQTSRDRMEQRKNRIMNLVELLLGILEEENWGIYYKSKPMQSLALQEGDSLYKINEVDEEHIESAIEKSITEKDYWQKSSQTSSNQTENSKSG